MVTFKTPPEIERMAAAGALLGSVHERLRRAVVPRVTTRDLDALAEELIRAGGGQPSFKGYHGYPATLNTSVNDEIVHAIPCGRRLRRGDLVTIDCGVLMDGFHSDAACTWVVGGPTAATAAERLLVDATREALLAGIAMLQPGGRLGDVSAAIAAVGARGGYGVIADHDGTVLGGHGVGRHLHEDPLVPNRGRAGRGMRLRPGLVFAIEPMFTLGGRGWRVLADGWTTVTLDGSRSAHWEHTVAVTDDGPRVLTARPGEALALPAVGGRGTAQA